MNETRKQLQSQTTNYEEHLPNIVGFNGDKGALNADKFLLGSQQDV